VLEKAWRLPNQWFARLPARRNADKSLREAMQSERGLIDADSVATHQTARRKTGRGDQAGTVIIAYRVKHGRFYLRLSKDDQENIEPDHFDPHARFEDVASRKC